MGRRTRNTSSSEFPILGELGLYAAPTKGDGNCLFRALSDQFYGDESHHQEIRQRVVAYVNEHHNHFSAFVGEYGETFDQYVTRLAQDGVYGGHIEIVGFADVYQSPVVIYQAEELYIVEPQNTTRSAWQKAAHIAYHTWEHYSSVRRIGGPETGLINIGIPQQGDLPGTDSSQDGATCGETVPEWKVNIVLKSVCDAPLEKVKAMLKTKDHGEVIEELLMEQYENNLEPDPVPASTSTVTAATDTTTHPSLSKEEPGESKPASEPRSSQSADVPSPEPSERLSGRSPSMEGTVSLTEAQRRSGRRLEARKRRHEKKERARLKKTNPKTREEQRARDEAEDDTLPDVKPRRIIHI